MPYSDAAILAELERLVGTNHVLLPKDRPPPGRFDSSLGGSALATVRPANTQEVSNVVAYLSTAQRSIIPVGGATGLVNGCLTSAGDVLISTDRLREIEAIVPSQKIIKVGAGVPLQLVQEAAAELQLYFPLDLGARGSATVGGAIATNAGGNRVIRFGMMRDLVLGLEVVMADGRIVSSMNTLIKNNTGYDIKQLFIGSEGTLGIVTRAVLRLWPAPTERQMAFVGLSSLDAASALLSAVDRESEGRLTAFEAMWPRFYELASVNLPNGRAPLECRHQLFALIELQGGVDAREALELCLNQAIEDELVDDAVIARSEADCQTFWNIRDNVEPIADLGELLMFDVGLPLGEMQEYVGVVQSRLAGVKGVREAVVWGHIGDGNLHIWVACASITDKTRTEVNDIIYGPLSDIGGSISAEHGIGLEKRSYLHLSRSRQEIEIMTTLKFALDPQNILNPGKVLPDLKKEKY